MRQGRFIVLENVAGPSNGGFINEQREQQKKIADEDSVDEDEIDTAEEYLDKCK